VEGLLPLGDPVTAIISATTRRVTQPIINGLRILEAGMAAIAATVATTATSSADS
jgi:hypothetical protein